MDQEQELKMTSVRHNDCLPLRARNALIQKGINFFEDLVYHSETELLRQPNFGRKSLTDLKAFLSESLPHVKIGAVLHKQEPKSFVYKSPSDEARLLDEANQRLSDLMFAMRVMGSALEKANQYLEKVRNREGI